MTAATDRRHRYDTYATVMRMARQGFGWENIVVKLKLSYAEDGAWVRRVVMSTRAEYRGWQK